MMAKAGGRNSSLVRMVQERAMLKVAEEEEVLASAPHLPEDCVSCILIRLPIESLQQSRCVCKLWYDMIHNPAIIYGHARQSETVILFQTSATQIPQTISCLFAPSVKDNPRAFSVENCLADPNNFFARPDVKPWSKLYLHFVEVIDGEGVIRDFNVSCMGRIMASCDGLVLLENKLKEGGLILMNPVSRKLVSLPVGTISLPHKRSFSLVWNHSTTKYKVVHLFSDDLGFTSCETIEVGARSWKMIDGPSFGFIGWFRYKSVSAIGALHWLPKIAYNDSIVSMETRKEKFTTIELPEVGGIHDRILEMGAFLCFSTREKDKINIWVLKDISDEKWTRLHRITMCNIQDMVPVSGSRSGGQIIFTRNKDGSLYVYEFHLKSLKKIEMRDDLRSFEKVFLPHVNTLVSWTTGGKSGYK